MTSVELNMRSSNQLRVRSISSNISVKFSISLLSLFFPFLMVSVVQNISPREELTFSESIAISLAKNIQNSPNIIIHSFSYILVNLLIKDEAKNGNYNENCIHTLLYELTFLSNFHRKYVNSI